MIEQVLHKKTEIKYNWGHGITEIQYFNIKITESLWVFWFMDYSKKYPNSSYNVFFEEYKKKQDEEGLRKHVWDNIPILKKAALEFANELEKEEEYWMKNMPFYKKK
jgi:hypothetical protein